MSLLFFASISVSGSALRDLWEPDEGRYAQIAHEMYSTGEWLIPRLAGCPFLEKPPLSYWASALSMKVFGDAPFAIRLPSILAGCLVLLFVYSYARRLFGGVTARRSVWILVSSPLFLVSGQTVFPDALFSAFVTISLCNFHLASVDEERQLPRWLAWLSLAAATLTKGPLAIVLVAGVMLAARWTGAISSLKGIMRSGPLMVFLVIAVPWFAWASMYVPHFVDIYVFHVHLARTVGAETTGDLHSEPFFYFLVAFWGIALPGTLLLPTALWRRVRSPRVERRPTGRDLCRQPR